MNCRKALKTAITVLMIAILFAAAAVSANAVPAKPGTAHEGTSGACRSHHGELVTLDTIPTRNNGANRAPSIARAEKDIPLLTIVVGFSNMPYENGYDWAYTIFSSPKSLSAYYSDMSFGKFTFTPAAETAAFGVDGNTNTADQINDGVIHVTLSAAHKDWAHENENPAMARALIAAIEAADAYVDFASFDADGNGKISENELAVSFVLAGYEGSFTDNYKLGKEFYLWAHAWSIGDIRESYDSALRIPTPDGTEINAYIAIAERLESLEQEPISLLAHELGHYLGLPDLYDTSVSLANKWSKYDVSYLSVMADGSWGDDPDGGYIPYSMDLWSRFALGWCDPQMINSDGGYTVTAQSYTQDEAFTALYLPTQREGEYYLVENRRFVKWDAGLAGKYDHGGLILWHIDDAVFEQYNPGNQVNDAFHRPAVMPLYPEQLNGAYTYTGNTSKVLLNKPFYSASDWAALFGTNAAPLNLPLYGSGSNADTRSARMLSGLKLSFPDDSASQMTVRLSTADHVHFLQKIGLVEATLTQPGMEAHWACTYCGATYADSQGKNPVTEESLVIPPGGTPRIPADADICEWDNVDHGNSIWGRLTKYFHSVLLFFAKLFGRR